SIVNANKPLFFVFLRPRLVFFIIFNNGLRKSGQLAKKFAKPSMVSYIVDTFSAENRRISIHEQS
ncbi:MAG: hypothetical protein II520_01015, partial [Bacilli bacterium]|nr:hypothetical protein [Bacilli bacterium]